MIFFVLNQDSSAIRQVIIRYSGKSCVSLYIAIKNMTKHFYKVIAYTIHSGGERGWMLVF